MWKFKFDAPKGSRTHSEGFVDVTCFRQDISSDVVIPKFNSKINKWVQDNSWDSTNGTKHVKSFRAFKKYLRKHPELQVEGIDVVLVNKYFNRGVDGDFVHGYDIVANWVKV